MASALRKFGQCYFATSSFMPLPMLVASSGTISMCNLPPVKYEGLLLADIARDDTRRY